MGAEPLPAPVEDHVSQETREMEAIWDMASKRRLGLMGFSPSNNAFIIYRKQADGQTAGFALPEELNDMLKTFFLR